MPQNAREHQGRNIIPVQPLAMHASPPSVFPRAHPVIPSPPEPMPDATNSAHFASFEAGQIRKQPRACVCVRGIEPLPVPLFVSHLPKCESEPVQCAAGSRNLRPGPCKNGVPFFVFPASPLQFCRPAIQLSSPLGTPSPLVCHNPPPQYLSQKPLPAP